MSIELMLFKIKYPCVDTLGFEDDIKMIIIELGYPIRVTDFGSVIFLYYSNKSVLQLFRYTEIKYSCIFKNKMDTLDEAISCIKEQLCQLKQ